MKMTRHGDYEKRILFPVFSNYQVRIVFTEDLAKSYVIRFKRPLPRDVDTTTGFHAYTATGCSHLFFRIGNASSGTIAHECVHVVSALLVKWAGVERMDEEVVAYHVGYLVDQIVMLRNALIDAGVGVEQECRKTDGELQCSWEGCDVTDPDMLSLDHVNNDGAEARRTGEGGTRIFV